MTRRNRHQEDVRRRMAEARRAAEQARRNDPAVQAEEAWAMAEFMNAMWGCDCGCVVFDPVEESAIEIKEWRESEMQGT